MNRSVLIAFGIFFLLCLYMLTGLIGCSREADDTRTEAGIPEIPRMSVKVREMTAVEIPREVVISGKTVPSRTVDLKAETAGRIVFVKDLRGRALREGDLIARIDIKDREQRLSQANAAVRQAQLEYEAALRLQEQGLRSDSQVSQALAALRGTEQALRMIQLDIEDTEIVAPFAGVLQEREVEVGDYLGIGDPVARVIDLDPLVAEGQVTEFEISYMHIGEEGRASLVSGEVVNGMIRYVAGEADPQTRTFTVELEIPNPDLELEAGITAQIAVETERVPAYRISPGFISIEDDGQFGVKIVDAENKVRFYPADIVKSEPEALWLTGLPERIRLITMGQGFTQPGDIVNPVMESDTGN